jgi:hypothetical protein
VSFLSPSTFSLPTSVPIISLVPASFPKNPPQKTNRTNSFSRRTKRRRQGRINLFAFAPSYQSIHPSFDQSIHSSSFFHPGLDCLRNPSPSSSLTHSLTHSNSLHPILLQLSGQKLGPQSYLITSHHIILHNAALQHRSLFSYYIIPNHYIHTTSRLAIHCIATGHDHDYHDHNDTRLDGSKPNPNPDPDLHNAAGYDIREKATLGFYFYTTANQSPYRRARF